MEMNVSKEVAALQRMTTTQLREKYAEVFGEATTTGNRTWLIRRIAWRIQALAEGDLSERARQRAAELARDADLRIVAPRQKPIPVATAEPTRTVTREVAPAGDTRLPPPGSVITRKYKGTVVQVKVLTDEFEYAGERYASLSAVAKAVTGSHCNGFLFFRLNKAGAA
jgi:hypothetical protein